MILKAGERKRRGRVKEKRRNTSSKVPRFSETYDVERCCLYTVKIEIEITVK